MLTESSIKSYLSLNYKDLTQSEYSSLVDNYFKVHSKEWFVENEKDATLNLEERDRIFWKLIRRHAMPHGLENRFFDFSGFVFPAFEDVNHLYKTNRRLIFPENFWNKDQTKEFAHDVNFMSARFLGDVILKFTQFRGNVNFYSSKFLGKANMIEASFNKEVKFNSTQFASDFNLTQAQFSTEYRTIFHYCFKEEKLINDSDYISSPFNYQVLFNFSDVEFNSKMVFRGIHFHKTSFLRANIPKDVRFEDCKWGGNGRLVLCDEPKLFWKFSKNKESFQNYLERYRQLKLNYTSFQEWDLSGQAYRSEMYMRQGLTLLEVFNLKKLHMIPIRIIEFLISFTYGLFSGYTQSVTKPFIWLILSTVIVFPYLYSDCSLTQILNCDFTSSLNTSASNTFPFFRLEKNSDIFWLGLTQKLFSSTLLAFFILALRKKYKQ